MSVLVRRNTGTFMLLHRGFLPFPVFYEFRFADKLQFERSFSAARAGPINTLRPPRFRQHSGVVLDMTEVTWNGFADTFSLTIFFPVLLLAAHPVCAGNTNNKQQEWSLNISHPAGHLGVPLTATHIVTSGHRYCRGFGPQYPPRTRRI